MDTSIKEGQSYIFKFEPKILTKYSSASCSENVKNKYIKWAQISGKQVVVVEGQSYIFKFDDGLTKGSSGASEDLKNKYTKWAQVSGKQVVVIEIDTVLKANLVYIKQDGPDFWFRSSSCFLFECTCDLTLLMNRGCQCGFFDIEQTASQ